MRYGPAVLVIVTAELMFIAVAGNVTAAITAIAIAGMKRREVHFKYFPLARTVA